MKTKRYKPLFLFLAIALSSVFCATPKTKTQPLVSSASMSVRKGDVLLSRASVLAQKNNKDILYKEWLFDGSDSQNFFLLYKERQDLDKTFARQERYKFPLTQQTILLDDYILWIESLNGQELRFHLQLQKSK